MILSRRIAKAANGKEAWRQHVGADGRIHGAIIHIGTPHRRANHLPPNIAQVPEPETGKPFAPNAGRYSAPAMIGSLFVATKPDCKTADSRIISSHSTAATMPRHSSMALDPHWKCSIDLGLIPAGTVLDKANKVHTAIREGAKSFRYAFLYGAGAAQAGRIVGNIIRTVAQIAPDNDLHRHLFGNCGAPKRNRASSGSAKTPSTNSSRHARLAASTAKLEGGTRARWLAARARRPAHTGARALHSVEFSRHLERGDHLQAMAGQRLRRAASNFVMAGMATSCSCCGSTTNSCACCRPEIAEQIGEIMVRHASEPASFTASRCRSSRLQDRPQLGRGSA